MLHFHFWNIYYVLHAELYSIRAFNFFALVFLFVEVKKLQMMTLRKKKGLKCPLIILNLNLFRVVCSCSHEGKQQDYSNAFCLTSTEKISQKKKKFQTHIRSYLIKFIKFCVFFSPVMLINY